MQLDGAQARVREVVERIDVLRHHGVDEAEPAQVADRKVGGVGTRAVQAAPPQERAGPVPLAGFVRGNELVVVDRAVGLVLGVGALGAAVVGQARRDAHAGAGEEDGLVRRGILVAGGRGRRRGGQKVGEGADRAVTRGCGGRDDQWWWERPSVGDSHQRFGHMQSMAWRRGRTPWKEDGRKGEGRGRERESER